MSNRHDECERCGQRPFYDGHLPWCAAMSELEDRIEVLEDQVRDLIDRKTTQTGD